MELARTWPPVYTLFTGHSLTSAQLIQFCNFPCPTKTDSMGMLRSLHCETRTPYLIAIREKVLRESERKWRSGGNRHPQISGKTTIPMLRSYPLSKRKGSIKVDLARGFIYSRNKAKKRSEKIKKKERITAATYDDIGLLDNMIRPLPSVELAGT